MQRGFQPIDFRAHRESIPGFMVQSNDLSPGLALAWKPRLVHLEILPQGQEPFSIGSYSHKAIHYVVKVKESAA